MENLFRDWHSTARLLVKSSAGLALASSLFVGCGSDDSPAAAGAPAAGSGGSGGSGQQGAGGTGAGAGTNGASGSAGDASTTSDAGQDAPTSDAPAPDGGSTIGPQGGEVLGPGGAKLTIPAGALASDTEVRIVEATDAPALRSDAKVVGRTLAFLPHGLTFAVPATVTLPFDTAAAGQDKPLLFWAEQGKPWTVLTEATSSGGALQAQITHLSYGEPVVPVWRTTVETKGGHTCALGASGSIWCWGRTLGATTPVEKPTRIDQGGAAFMSITNGATYDCGIDSSGSIWCWGDNGSGRLGDGTTETRPTPVKIMSSLRFLSVSAGGTHTCAITATTAELYCWGDNTRGQLGEGPPGSAYSKLVPTKVTTPAARWATVSTGGIATCATTDQSELYCWGDNSYGQLGIGPTPELASTPTKVALSAHSVSVGRVTCALSSTSPIDSDAYCWGETTNGMIGNGVVSPIVAYQPTPSKVVGGLSWKSMANGGFTTCGLTTNSRVYCFGSNARGTMGINAPANSGTPVQVPGVPDAISVSTSGIGTVCAMSNLLDVWCWGDNSDGALGIGPRDTMPHPTPTKIPLL